MSTNAPGRRAATGAGSRYLPEDAVVSMLLRSTTAQVAAAMQHLVIGYHGTNRGMAERLRDGHFDPSLPTDAWLGPGLYFWEQDEECAWASTDTGSPISG